MSLEAGYTCTRDLLTGQPIRGNSNFTLNTQGDNLNHELQYSADLNFYKPLNDNWYIQNYVSAYYIENEFIARGSANQVAQNNTTGFYVSMFNRFKLFQNGTLSLDVQASYLSSLIFGSYDFRSQLTSSVGLYKSYGTGVVLLP